MAGRSRSPLVGGGAGDTAAPAHRSVPKCLVPIAGRPLLDYWIDRLGDAGIREARVNTHAQAEQVRAYIGRDQLRGIRPAGRVIRADAPGLGRHRHRQRRPGGRCRSDRVIYADNFSDIDLRPLLAFHRSHGDPLTMVLFHAPDPRACGIAELDASGRIVSFVEKPDSRPATWPTRACTSSMPTPTARSPRCDAFDLGFEVLPRFVGRMRGWVWGGYHLDIGTHEALERARRDAPRSCRRGQGRSRAKPSGRLPRPRRHPDRARPLPVRPGPCPAAARDAEASTAPPAGFVRVLVTNQSAIGRGMITESRLHEIHAEMNRQLAERGTALDAIYYCPDVPAGDDRTVVEHHEPQARPGHAAPGRMPTRPGPCQRHGWWAT